MPTPWGIFGNGMPGPPGPAGPAGTPGAPGSPGTPGAPAVGVSSGGDTTEESFTDVGVFGSSVPGTRGPAGPAGPSAIGLSSGTDFLDETITDLSILGNASTKPFATLVRANKSMTASLTTADGQQACATAIAFDPALPSPNGGYVGLLVQGVRTQVGDGTKVAVECYYSRDGGTTALAMQSIKNGDLPYWNGSVAGYQLDTTMKIDYIYSVSS